MKKILTIISLVALLAATVSPAYAWRRGYGYRGGYYNGYGYRNYNNNWGAAAGVGLGLGILGGAIAADQYYRNQQYYNNPYYGNPYYPGW